ncbi:hypothetical protein [Sphingobium nicotianae]|uniref:Circumsporozoite protein n=1 Tax=Sphingobium nicotianae TaxID=2782607 RepID=A0A9X1D9F1_9SPHN|nr:hypothetical protein [Sphingobium nicotianae]MBT2185571.1 hypothetical protein [Sphingobium nicotianae]
MKKFAVACAAAALMTLAACGEKPAATNNAANEVVVNEVANAANATDNAANAIDNAANATNAMANATNAAK